MKEGAALLWRSPENYNRSATEPCRVALEVCHACTLRPRGARNYHRHDKEKAPGRDDSPILNPEFWLCRIMAGVRARAEADPSFLFKLGCECGLDLAIILTVNLACRRDKFLRELDFVLSQVRAFIKTSHCNPQLYSCPGLGACRYSKPASFSARHIYDVAG